MIFDTLCVCQSCLCTWKMMRAMIQISWQKSLSGWTVDVNFAVSVWGGGAGWMWVLSNIPDIFTCFCAKTFLTNMCHIFLYAKMHRQDGTSSLFPAGECEMTSSCLDMLGAWSDRPHSGRRFTWLHVSLFVANAEFLWRWSVTFVTWTHRAQNDESTMCTYCLWLVIRVRVQVLSRTTSGRWRCLAQQRWSLC